MKDEQMLFEQYPMLQAHIQWMANNATGFSGLRWSGFLVSLNDALATASRAGFDAAKEQAADELGRQLAAAEAALQSSKLDCLSLETQLAETQARLAKAVEALREIDGHLTNMQPKLVNGPLALDKDRLAMVDRYVGPAIDAVRSVLTSLESRDEAN